MDTARKIEEEEKEGNQNQTNKQKKTPKIQFNIGDYIWIHNPL